MSTVQLPRVEGPDGVEALAAALRQVPLEPQRSTTKEVRAWAEGAGLVGDDDELLSAYNEAASTLPDQLRKQLENIAAEPGGRAAVIGLLGFTGASDPVRLLAIEALEGKVGAADAGELARVNVKQRDQVIGAGVRLLASVNSGEALFALEKVFAKRDDATGESAARYASRLHTSVAEAAYVADVTQVRDVTLDLSELETREVLFSALALPARRQRRIAGTDAGDKLLATVAPEVLGLDESLRERSKDTSLPPYLSRVREELLEFVLLTASPDQGDLQKRASEALFRRDDLGEVEELAPHLPRSVLENYATRALTKENRRRGRPERAVAALGFVREREDKARESLREAAVECLTEADAPLRLAAARLLAVDEQELGAEVRSAMLKCLESLPPRQQSILAREMKGRSGGPQGHDAFVRWVEAARGDELPHRLGDLLERWAGQKRLEPEQAGELIEVFGSGFSRLETSARGPLEADLVAVVADWIKSRGAQIVGSVGPLMRWQRFRQIAVEYFPEFATRLRADQARGLLVEALGARAGEPLPALIKVTSELDLPEDHRERLVIPALVDAIAVDLEAVSVAFSSCGHAGQQALLIAGLLSLSTTRAQTIELELTLVNKTTAGLSAKSQLVLAAVADAQEAAEGNERLVAVLEEVNRAIATHSGDEAPIGASAAGVGSDPARADEAPPPAVIGWREKTLGEYPHLFGTGADPRQELTPGVDLCTNPSDLANVIAELDKRAHSTRLAPPAERPLYLRDLTILIRAAINQGVFIAADEGTGLGVAGEVADRGGQRLIDVITSGRPEIRKLFWAEWADRKDGSTLGSDPNERAGTGNADLLAALTSAAGSPHDPGALSMLEGATDGVGYEIAASSARKLDVEQAPRAWAALATLLELQLRKLGEITERSRNKEKAIGAEVGDALDLPFRVIEQLFFNYFRLRAQLREAGWIQVEDRLGQVRKAGQLDPDRHDVRGGASERYVVRTLGIQYKGAVISRAVVEPLEEADSSVEDGEQAREQAST